MFICGISQSPPLQLDLAGAAGGVPRVRTVSSTRASASVNSTMSSDEEDTVVTAQVEVECTEPLFPGIEAFRVVDRADFWIRGSRADLSSEVYQDAPLRYGKLHQSAPHIYARALEALMPLKTGMSFLNIGSGTGYFSSLVAEILGEGVNDGLELWPENVAHAQERCRQLGKHHITFNEGNVYQLDVNLGMRYSRIYAFGLDSLSFKSCQERMKQVLQVRLLVLLSSLAKAAKLHQEASL
eukprot:g1354.t1